MLKSVKAIERMHQYETESAQINLLYFIILMTLKRC
jgi:hypothetical protein